MKGCFHYSKTERVSDYNQDKYADYYDIASSEQQIRSDFANLEHWVQSQPGLLQYLLTVFKFKQLSGRTDTALITKSDIEDYLQEKNINTDVSGLAAMSNFTLAKSIVMIDEYFYEAHIANYNFLNHKAKILWQLPLQSMYINLGRQTKNSAEKIFGVFVHIYKEQDKNYLNLTFHRDIRSKEYDNFYGSYDIEFQPDERLELILDYFCERQCIKNNAQGSLFYDDEFKALFKQKLRNLLDGIVATVAFICHEENDDFIQKAMQTIRADLSYNVMHLGREEGRAIAQANRDAKKISAFKPKIVSDNRFETTQSARAEIVNLILQDSEQHERKIEDNNKKADS